MPILKTSLGAISYNERESSKEFLGLRYGYAERFKYAELVNKYSEDIYDATKNRECCIQKRCYYAHLEIPERMFYHKEFREGIDFKYSEDCFFLNIWTPKDEGIYPVMVFIHGGGFDSGSIPESSFDGDKLAKRGIIVVMLQYRVGPFGYLTNEELTKRNGHDGNFGLDDQFKAITWVNKHIKDFGGDTNNITLCGQSAGAMSIQYLCLSKKSKGLFNRVIMMSGAGLWPKFTLPKNHEETREYWNEVIELAGCKTIDEFISLEPKKLYDALEIQRNRRKDNSYNTMPVVDNYYLTNTVDVLIKNPLDVDYLVGFTNNDMFTIVIEHIAMKYRKQVNGYAYYFDCDAKGDNNQAFHSSDLRFIFGTLDKSWRPYDKKDYELSEIMMDYFSQFVKTGNPNKEGLPIWKKQNKALRFSSTKKIKMVRPGKLKLIRNTLKGDPK